MTYIYIYICMFMTVVTRARAARLEPRSLDTHDLPTKILPTKIC